MNCTWLGIAGKGNNRTSDNTNGGREKINDMSYQFTDATGVDEEWGEPLHEKIVAKISSKEKASHSNTFTLLSLAFPFLIHASSLPFVNIIFLIHYYLGFSFLFFHLNYIIKRIILRTSAVMLEKNRLRSTKEKCVERDNFS